MPPPNAVNHLNPKSCNWISENHLHHFPNFSPSPNRFGCHGFFQKMNSQNTPRQIQQIKYSRYFCFKNTYSYYYETISVRNLAYCGARVSARKIFGCVFCEFIFSKNPWRPNRFRQPRPKWFWNLQIRTLQILATKYTCAHNSPFRTLRRNKSYLNVIVLNCNNYNTCKGYNEFNI